MPSFSDKNITFTGEINRKGIAAMMEQLNKDAEQDGTLDLADLRVFKQQYEDNFRSLKYFGMQYIADEDVVSDLIQDTWLKIWERQETFPSLVAFRRYLFQVLYHAILNYLKHARVEHDFADRLSLSEPVEKEVAVKMIEAEVYSMVNTAFDELSDVCRQVYAASLSGKSQREIAEEFHITINTVKKHINNANHYLRRRLKHILFSVLQLFAR